MNTFNPGLLTCKIFVSVMVMEVVFGSGPEETAEARRQS